MKYKLTITPALEISQEAIVLHFNTEPEMNAASDAVSRTLLFLQDKLNVMEDHSNMFVKEQFVDGEWEEIEDEDDDWDDGQEEVL